MISTLIVRIDGVGGSRGGFAVGIFIVTGGRRGWGERSSDGVKGCGLSVETGR
jgi:hypothetical protein